MNYQYAKTRYGKSFHVIDFSSRGEDITSLCGEKDILGKTRTPNRPTAICARCAKVVEDARKSFRDAVDHMNKKPAPNKSHKTLPPKERYVVTMADGFVCLVTDDENAAKESVARHEGATLEKRPYIAALERKEVL